MYLINKIENYNNIPNFDIMTYTILYGTDIVNKYIWVYKCVIIIKYTTLFLLKLFLLLIFTNTYYL